MCLLMVDRNRFALVPLIITFNRDETYARPTASANFWQEDPRILAGRDLLKGGTWGGISTTGRMAFITFVRRKEPRKPFPRARGEIVPGFLKGSLTPREYFEELSRARSDYLGYNLVCGDVHNLFHYSNVTDCVTQLGAGVTGISNGLLNSAWPKEVACCAAIGELSESQVIDSEALFAIAARKERADAASVPTDTGMSFEKEWYRSSIFVESPGYGTCSTTVIIFYADGRIRFTERTHMPQPMDVSFTF